MSMVLVVRLTVYIGSDSGCNGGCSDGCKGDVVMVMTLLYARINVLMYKLVKGVRKAVLRLK